MSTLAFDIETIPDIETGRRLYDLNGLSDEETIQAMRHLRSQETGGPDFMRHHLHRIVAISVAFNSDDEFKLWTLGEPDNNEAQLIERFFEGIERYTPVLVSWNGSGFDLPVLHYRALKHGITAPRYWETGIEDHSFRYNNYLNRFHWRHLDLMDALSAYQARAAAPLDQIARLLDLPGKQGIGGDKIWEAWCGGQMQAIRDYCEIDVLLTHLIYLRFEVMRGRLGQDARKTQEDRIRTVLRNKNQPHLDDFLASWQ